MVHKLKTYDDPVLDRQIQAFSEWTKRPVINDRGEGVVLTTPDGTKQYKLTVSNAGVLSVTMI